MPGGRRPPWFRSLIPEWSARTVARFAAALRLLEFAAAGTDRETAMREAIRRATRANGSVNVARLFAVAEWYVFRRVARERVDPPENSGA